MKFNAKGQSQRSGCVIVPMFLSSLLVTSASTAAGAVFLRAIGAHAGSENWPAFDTSWCVILVFLSGLACGVGAVVALALAVHPAHRGLALHAMLGGAAAFFIMFACEIYPLA